MHPHHPTDSNQIFSLARWLLLVKKHWMENRKRYLLAFLAMAGLSLTWFSFILLMTNYHEVPVVMQFLSYFIGLYFIGALFASSAFAGLGNKGEGVDYLSVPASHLEKLLCAILFSLFLFFIAFNLAFYLVDIPMVKLSRHFMTTRYTAWRVVPFEIGDNYCLNIFTGAGEPPPFRGNTILIYGFFAVQSAFILGSIYFRSYAFIKTIVTVLLLMLVGMLFVTKIIESDLPHGVRLEGLLQWVLFDRPGEPSFVRLSPWIEQVLNLCMEFSLPLIFCWAAYHRLKEKEV